jgi:hypothetical protein
MAGSNGNEQQRVMPKCVSALVRGRKTDSSTLPFVWFANLTYGHSKPAEAAQPS